MRTYEALYIVRPDLSEDEIQAVSNEVESLVTDNGGAIARSEIWGKRKLAYTVKKFTEGCYVMLRFTSQPTFVEILENYFRLSEKVIRFMTVHFDKQTLKLEDEQIKAKEESERSAREAQRPNDNEDLPRKKVDVSDADKKDESEKKIESEKDEEKVEQEPVEAATEE